MKMTLLQASRLYREARVSYYRINDKFWLFAIEDIIEHQNTPGKASRRTSCLRKIGWVIRSQHALGGWATNLGSVVLVCFIKLIITTTNSNKNDNINNNTTVFRLKRKSCSVSKTQTEASVFGSKRKSWSVWKHKSKKSNSFLTEKHKLNALK